MHAEKSWGLFSTYWGSSLHSEPLLPFSLHPLCLEAAICWILSYQFLDFYLVLLWQIITLKLRQVEGLGQGRGGLRGVWMIGTVLYSDSPLPSDPDPLSFHQNGVLPLSRWALSQEEPQPLMQIGWWQGHPARQSSRWNYIKGFHSCLENNLQKPTEKEGGR